MTNPIQLLRDLFKPRAKMLYHPMLPDYLRRADGSTDLDWVILYRNRPWSKWQYLYDKLGCPMCFCKEHAEMIIKYINHKQFDL